MRYVAEKYLSHTTALVLIACIGSAAQASGSAAGQSDQVRSISAADKEKGAQAHPELMEEFGGAYTGRQVDYVVSVGQNIAVQSGLGDAKKDFTVTLLNSPANNAFAIPGGYVYLTRQLMALMNDEAEMAGVLGHEVGHVAARHGQKRQKAAKRNNILGMLGQIGSAVLLGDTVAGNIGQKIFGTGSQLLTLKYSRKQEYQADDLGIKYLASAGYDPKALSTMLYSLAAQSAIDAKVAGRDARSAPEWSSTHPAPARRVKRAEKNAAKLGVEGGRRGRDAFLANLDGITYGDDPKQGVIEGNKFLHPDLKLKFTVPNGFSMQNGARAVTIRGSSGQGQFSTGAYSGNMGTYIAAAFKGLIGDKKITSTGELKKLTINGLPATYGIKRVKSDNGQVDVTVFAYQLSKTSAFHFATIAPAGSASVFTSMYRSMGRLSESETSTIKPRKVDVVTVKKGDTIASLSKKMAYKNYQQDRFLVLNRMQANTNLRTGEKVKLITY